MKSKITFTFFLLVAFFILSSLASSGPATVKPAGCPVQQRIPDTSSSAWLEQVPVLIN